MAASRRRSLRPRRYDTYSTQQTPTTSAGIMGTNTVLTSMESALAARAVGRDPVRGPYLDNTDIGSVLQEMAVRK